MGVAPGDVSTVTPVSWPYRQEHNCQTVEQTPLPQGPGQRCSSLGLTAVLGITGLVKDSGKVLKNKWFKAGHLRDCSGERRLRDQ